MKLLIQGKRTFVCVFFVGWEYQLDIFERRLQIVLFKTRLMAAEWHF